MKRNSKTFQKLQLFIKDGSTNSAKSKVELFTKVMNGFQLPTVVAKESVFRMINMILTHTNNFFQLLHTLS